MKVIQLLQHFEQLSSVCAQAVAAWSSEYGIKAIVGEIMRYFSVQYASCEVFIYIAKHKSHEIHVEEQYMQNKFQYIKKSFPPLSMFPLQLKGFFGCSFGCTASLGMRVVLYKLNIFYYYYCCCFFLIFLLLYIKCTIGSTDLNKDIFDKFSTKFD